MYRIDLTDADRALVDALLEELLAEEPATDEQLLDAVALRAQEMPRTLRARLNAFRLKEPSGGCVISGFQVDDAAIGATPAQWGEADDDGRTRREDMFLLMCASLLGDPIAWATQQDGRLLHDVVPIKGHEHAQLNSSTAEPLTWHTEDAFHPYRAEYVGLLCLRNPDAVQTTYALFDDLELDEETRRVLAGPRYVIRPDNSHQPENRTARSRLQAPADLVERSARRIDRLNTAPEKVPVLFGDPRTPYGRLDPYFMDRTDDDPEAAAAFEALVEQIDAKLTGIALRPGDVLFIDNYKAVHGRNPYQARYDGHDRWLRRVNVTRDLRKSRDARVSADSRVVF
ncbi:guanitoxin biosynthesis L-enduracididine beta-hydroxylase GntD [Streptomyces sp. NPDC047841]|uniref:guanitoxin biosynthesis L-enduracididine beta-hydroxylase GntD n=1 Tax=Streptomyces sp. NPDC047841 TaxID=3154708 RepID=UPI0034549E58